MPRKGRDAKEYKQKEEQQQAAEKPRDERYHLDYRRNGTEDEIIISAPDGRHMAYIQFWDEGWMDLAAATQKRRPIPGLSSMLSTLTPPARAEATFPPATARPKPTMPPPAETLSTTQTP